MDGVGEEVGAFTGPRRKIAATSPLSGRYLPKKREEGSDVTGMTRGWAKAKA